MLTRRVKPRVSTGESPARGDGTGGLPRSGWPRGRCSGERGLGRIPPASVWSKQSPGPCRPGEAAGRSRQRGLRRSREPGPRSRGSALGRNGGEFGSVCVKAGVPVSSGRPTDAEAGPTSDAIIECVRLHEAVHLEEPQQFLLEGKAGVKVAQRKVDVRDAVKLHARVLTANGEPGRAQPPGSC